MGQDRVLQILLGVGRRKLRGDLQAARKDFAKFGKETSGKLRASFKDAFSTVAGVGSVAGVAAIGKSVLDVDRKLTRLGIQAGQSKADMVAFHDQLRDLSDDTGLSAEQLADASAQFVSLTGNFDQAKEGAVVFAKAAQASGASIEDVAAAAASLSNNLGIKDVQGFEKGLSILITQGKLGAVELRELAGLLPTIAPSFTKFGKSGTAGLAELGAALQIVRQGFGSGSEAATGMNALMTALAKNADRFKGVKMFTTDENGVKHFRQLSDIIAQISESKLMKSPTKLTKAFGSSEAMRAFMELDKNYQGFMDLWEESLSSTAVKDDFATYMESNAGRIDKAWQRIQNTLARELTPERIDALVDAFEMLGRGAAWVVRNIKALAIAYGALKLAQWSMRLYSLTSALGSAGGAAEKLSGATDQLGGRGLAGISKFGRALGGLGAIASVGVLSYELGGLLAKALGLADSLEKIDDLTAKEPASEFDPDRKAQLHLNKANDFRERANKVQEELEKEKDLTPEQKSRMEIAGFKTLSDQEIREKQSRLDWLNRREAEERRAANAEQSLERVNQDGKVDLMAATHIDRQMPEAAQRAARATLPNQEALAAMAKAVIQQTGRKGDDPEVVRTLQEMVALLREAHEREYQQQQETQAAVSAQLDALNKLNESTAKREEQAALAVAWWQNDPGRAPAP